MVLGEMSVTSSRTCHNGSAVAIDVSGRYTRIEGLSISITRDCPLTVNSVAIAISVKNIRFMIEKDLGGY